VIIWILQRGLDVMPQRAGHARSGCDDPAEPGHRGDGQQDLGDLVFFSWRCAAARCAAW
jgi:hypothetical protein